MADYQPYPAPVKKQGGAKISSYYYNDKLVANQATDIALHNARLMEAEGHEFGFVYPGEQRYVESEKLWEVAIC